MMNSYLYVGEAVLLLATVVVATLLIMVKVNQSRWNKRVAEFWNNHHGYTTNKSPKIPNHDVLLVVCPTSGNGRAMKEYEPTVTGLEAQGRQVEVYVTKSKEDLMTLVERKPLQPYAMIAILSGDSSVFEFVQPALRQNNGKWPYASPILHLPGGCGNAMASEFYGREMVIPDILAQAKQVEKLSVVKAYNKEGAVRYALHNCFDGLQTVLIDWFDNNRAIASILGADCGLLVLLLFFFVTFPFRRNMNPIVLNVVNSDFEGSGMILGFGVTRFDPKMAVAYSTSPYKSKYQVVPAYFHFLSSKLATNVRDGKELPHNLSCQVCDRFTTEKGYYKLYFDGSSSLPLEGDEICFEIVPEAVPVLTVPR